MGRIYSSNENHTVPVRVATRWHQLSILFGLATCCLAMFTLGSMADMSFWLIAVGGTVGFVLPPVFAFRVWPTQDTVTILCDALLFSQRGRVPYSTIASYKTDDYLKLVRRAGPTWILTSTDIPRLRTEFISAIDAWQAEQGTHERVIRTRFYGTLGARVLGCCLVAVSACLTIFSWSIGLKYGAMAALGLGLSAAAVLLPKRT